MKKSIASLVAISTLLVSGTSALAAPIQGVECDSAAYFGDNACTSCFTTSVEREGSQAVTLHNIGFTWENSGDVDLVVYENEQVSPEFISFPETGATWDQTPEASSDFWQFGDDVVWEDFENLGINEFFLSTGESVDFVVSKDGSEYALVGDSIADQSTIALIKNTINYHGINPDFTETDTLSEVQCLAYTFTQVSPVVVNDTPEEEVVITEEMTEVQTGPETMIIALLALILAFGVVFFIQRKNA